MVTTPKLPELKECLDNALSQAQDGVVGVSYAEPGVGLDDPWGSILDTKPLAVLACAESPAQSTDGLSLPSLRLFTLFISCHLDVVLLSGCTLAV